MIINKKQLRKLIQRVKTFWTSFIALESASESENTGIELHDSSEYLFRIDTSSTREQLFPLWCKAATSLLRVNFGGKPKSGPGATEVKKIRHWKIDSYLNKHVSDAAQKKPDSCYNPKQGKSMSCNNGHV